MTVEVTKFCDYCHTSYGACAMCASETTERNTLEYLQSVLLIEDKRAEALEIPEAMRRNVRHALKVIEKKLKGGTNA